jgi:hypothetical protein
MFSHPREKKANVTDLILLKIPRIISMTKRNAEEYRLLFQPPFEHYHIDVEHSNDFSDVVDHL